MSINATSSDFVFSPIFAALDEASRELIGRSSRGDARDDADDSNASPPKKRFTLLLIVLIVVIAGLAISSHEIAASRLVYVVNGSSESLRLTIDGGDEFEIAATSKEEINLPEGRHLWKIHFPAAAVAEGEFELATGFIERFTSSPMYVLDPARTSITIWEEAKYSAETPATEVTHQIHLGETFYEFTDIDFRFEPFPGTIKASGASATRTRVESILVEPARVIRFVGNDISSEQQLAFCERHLLLTPRDEELIAAYGKFTVQASEYQRLYQFLKDGINRRPIEIPWHRRYQSAALRIDKIDEIFAEYDELVEQLPDNGAALYLRGRIEPHGPLAEEYFNRSIGADPSNPYPYYAKCHQLVSLARYEEAYQAASRAIELDPDQQDMENILQRVRLALGQYEELEREQRKLIAEGPIDATAHFRLLKVLAAQNRLSEMRQAHNEFVLAVNSEIALDPHDLVLSSDRFLAYCNRDYTKMMELTLKVKNPLSRSNLMLEALVSLGMHQELNDSDLMDRPPAQRGFVRLHIAMIHELQGNKDESLASLNLAIDDFENGTPETQRIASTVGDFNDADLYDKLNAISMSAGERLHVNIAVAAQTTGETRQRFLDSCRKLNFSPRFPSHFVTQLIELLEAESRVEKREAGTQ
jgi:tetratricopeptide (TPR) repeat protein